MDVPVETATAQLSASSNTVSVGLALFSLPPASIRSSPQLQLWNINNRAINKTAKLSQERHPKSLIRQLEAIIQEDEKSSTKFRWKTSILINELKRLIDSEHSYRLVSTKISSNRTIHSRHSAKKLSQKHTTKQKDVTVEPLRKIFHCTAIPCRYESASAVEWKRHEETHWPQRRYMCMECPVSTLDSDFPGALRCLLCSALSLCLNEAHTHLLNFCKLAKENARTFARKDKLSSHLQKDHLVPPRTAMVRAEKCAHEIESEWDERSNHLIDDHFKKGGDMSLWQHFPAQTSHFPDIRTSFFKCQIPKSNKKKHKINHEPHQVDVLSYSIAKMSLGNHWRYITRDDSE